MALLPARLFPASQTVSGDIRPCLERGWSLMPPALQKAAYDQARVATPEEALRAGADLLVIGRPITGAADPGAAAAAIAASLRRAEVARR